MADRWIDVTGYEMTKRDDRYLILKRGGKLVRPNIADDDAALTVIAEVKDYDEARVIVRALRASLVLREGET